MKLKPGVKLTGVSPEIAFAAVIVNSVVGQYEAVVVTSVCDGKHSTNSLHYKGKAMDVRANTIPDGYLDEILRGLKESLGPEFDVLLESRGSDNVHFHIEHDPKE